MIRAMCAAFLFLLCASFASLPAQTAPTDIAAYFQGKQVRMKIDMPGTQKGVDLRFDKSSPMDWKQYSSRLKDFGIAIPKGETVTVTTVVVKKDMIEFQLDGGGFGTFGDDTNTKVEAKPVEKSAYEKQLEQDIANTDDPDRKRDLQRDLDRERDRRAREDAKNQRAADVASQIKAQQVAQNRMRGGSRFNLRWSGTIPPETLTPEGVMKALEPYVDFSERHAAGDDEPTQNGAMPATEGSAPAAASSSVTGSPTEQLKRGMLMSDVNALLGQGRQLSESVSPEGLKTQIFEYLPDDRRVEITYVDGLVVRFSITSR